MGAGLAACVARCPMALLIRGPPNPMTTATGSKQTRILFVVAVLAATTYLSFHWIFLGDRLRWPIDFQAFWSAGGRPLHEVYADHGMPFVYPPTALFLFKPFSLVPFVPSYVIWLALSMALFGVAVVRTCGAKVSALSFLSPAAAKGMTL